MEETLQPKIIESPPKDPTVGFDLRTQIRDARTNKIIIDQPYMLHIDRDRGQVFERNGKFYSLNGVENTEWNKKAVDAPTPAAQTLQPVNHQHPRK